MTEAADHATCTEGTSGNATGLVDVYISGNQVAGVIALILLFAASGCMLAVITSLFNISFVPSFVMVAVFPVLYLLGVLVIRDVQRRRICFEMERLLAECEEAAIEDLIGRTVLQRGSVWPEVYVKALSQILPSCGRVGVTVRNCPPKHVTPIEPITVTFEPRVLDEADESVVELEEAIEAPPATEPEQQDDCHKRTEVDPMLRRMKRNLTLGGGRGVLAIYVLMLLMGLWSYFARGRISPLLILAPVSLLSLLFIPGNWAQNWRRNWLLVPAGIIIREGRWFGDRTRLHLITRRDGVLVVHRASRNAWKVYAGNNDSHHKATVTPHEATLLLRAWLSPLPPPPLERLSDLA